MRKLWKDFCSVLNQKDLFYFKKYLKKILGKVAPEVKKLWKDSEKTVEGFLFRFEPERLIFFKKYLKIFSDG